MKILTVPFATLKVVSEKVNGLLSALKSELLFVLIGNQTGRPSRMYRLIFSVHHSAKPNLVKEQYIVQEPDYYGNYE